MATFVRHTTEGLLRPARRFKEGDRVVVKSTIEDFVVSSTEYDSQKNSWIYHLKDMNGIEYAYSVTEDELKRSWVKTQKAVPVEDKLLEAIPAPTKTSKEVKQAQEIRAGQRPKMTATLWEDEGTLVFQVEANGVVVGRREDNGFVNGTRLFNVTGMTRGRRDGLLKQEKIRNVVKIGPIHLKGVWIPFERALEFANREKIADILYPLFVHDITQFLDQISASTTRIPDSTAQEPNPIETVSDSRAVQTAETEDTGIPEENSRLSFPGNSSNMEEFFFLSINRGDYPTTESLVTRHPGLKNAIDSNGRSALQYAVVLGQHNTIRILLQMGTSVNGLGKIGRSPLSLAAQRGDEVIVKMLLEGGAHVDLRDLDFRTPLSWAMASGHNSVATLLRAKGAVVDNLATFTDSGYASGVLEADPALQESSQDDLGTVYSFGSVAETEKMNYQLAFASEILKALQLARIDEEVLDSMSSTLPDILKSFALKLGSGASNERDYNAMFFISKYRSGIISTLTDQWRDERRKMDQLESDQMSSRERVRVWREAQAHFSHTVSEDDQDLMEVEDDVDNIEYLIYDLELPQEIPVDLEFITKTPAYSWLLSKLLNQVRLTVPQPNAIDNLRQAIHKCFPVPRKINRQTPQILNTMTMTINWQLADFLEVHDFDGGHDPEHILKTFVTLTSDGRHIQAMTASQYLQQTWPQIGQLILDLVIDIIRKGQDSVQFERCTLAGKISGAHLDFTIVAPTDSIAEIGEILSWMGAVFRPSPKEGIVYECTPSIEGINPSIVGTPYAPVSKSCTIEYHLEEAGNYSAHCWHKLFHYAVVACGYPVMKRPTSVQGLEMSLGMMLALCQARHVGQYNDVITVKGFSSMFSLSEHESGMSTWHFSRTLDGSYIPYPSTSNGIKGGEVGIQEIVQDRHFVGWCSQFVYGPGNLDAVHQVQPSWLPRAHAGCQLFGVNIRRGHALPVESVSIARNQQSPHLTATQDLHRKLERIHAKPVVFWDTISQRGWLTNGTSALLHMTLASVERSNNPFASTYSLQKTDITQHETNTEMTAAYILLNEQNLKLQIRSHLGQPVYLQDRVEDIYYLLDLMMDRQAVAVGKNRSSLSMLEGWDFRDLVDAAPDILHPRVSPLDKDCSGWLQLLKDTDAVTIFGENFGELYRPLNSDFCQEWATLPSGKYYLAAGVADLRKIAEKYGGDNRKVPQKLTENTTWPIVRRTFEQCACFKALDHSDLTQILVPDPAFTKQPDMKNILRNTPNGSAVVFGPMSDPAWLRPNYLNNSTETYLKIPKHDNDSDLVDSGLGDSISSAPTGVSSPKHIDYRVAIICALPKELFAVRCLFDEIYSDPAFDKNDQNSYAFGRIFSCKVVAACLPGIYGTNSAAQVIVELKRSFPLEFCVMVGIAGGIPSLKNDIRLGDVVVSRPSGSHSGLVKYDFEKVMQDGISHALGSFNHPPQKLLSAIAILESDPHSRKPLASYIEKVGSYDSAYQYPGAKYDTLYDRDHTILKREPRKSTQPRIHYGLVASGDKLVKDAKVRDDVGNKHNALCFEMEGAGIVNVLPSLVIRGISDYSDARKNDIWQEYASATAAAFAKLILGKVRPPRSNEGKDYLTDL